MTRVALLALLGTWSSAASPMTVQAPYARDTLPVAGLLALHNQTRAAYGTLPVVWDRSLEAQARYFAYELARNGRLQHSPRVWRPGQGENLAMGTAGYYSAEALAATWAAEGRYFRSGVFPYVSRTGQWRDVGHYTQMIWPTTTRIGCGTAVGRGMLFLVCRYAAPGNRDGVRLGR